MCAALSFMIEKTIAEMLLIFVEKFASKQRKGLMSVFEYNTSDYNDSTMQGTTQLQKKQPTSGKNWRVLSWIRRSIYDIQYDCSEM